MLFSPDQIKQSLFSVFDSLLQNRAEVLMNPKKDFTKIKKISFEQTLLFPMIAGSENVPTELLDFFQADGIPSPSAMIQRRNQIKPSAFIDLFNLFTKKIPVMNTFYGYRLLACDGSTLNLPYNPADPDTFCHVAKGRRGINQIHLNSLYDLMNDVFLDAELQSIYSMNEKGAFCQMMQRQMLSEGKNLYIADRGYASYNLFAFAIHNNQSFLIRVPQSFAEGISSDEDQWLQSECEDRIITIHIGRRRTKQHLQLKNYHCIRSEGHYDFIEPHSDTVDKLRLRVLKFPISDSSYEYIVTNLPQHRFSSAVIKELYHLRWGIETAFRHLKYAANMVRIHSLKKSFLLQEIYAKLTMYNFSSYMAAVVSGKCEKSTPKYEYRINRTQLIKICIRFLRGTIENIKDLIRRNVVPVRLGRSFERRLRRQSADTLTYR